MHTMGDINLKSKYIASRMISPVAQVVKNLPAMWQIWVQLLILRVQRRDLPTTIAGSWTSEDGSQPGPQKA